MSEKRSAWEIVQTARDPKRITSRYIIENVFTDFTELHGDKLFADDGAVIGGIGFLDDVAVTVIGQEKGVDLRDKVARNFGCANPEGYRKSQRLMKQAEKFHRPLICIVDTQGAFCGVGAEERGVAEAIARNMLELSRLKTPVISIFIGEGGSGGAIALAVADRRMMLSNAVYSILSPEGFSSILWKDSSRAAEAAELMRMTADEVKNLGLIDDVIEEPVGGARAEDGGVFAKSVKKYLCESMKELMAEPVDELIQKRYDKLRSFGQESVKDV
ncbi:MAG: acetyl-CoA carboxylase carboxyltransferase subunit alpha [Christensenella sp.]